MEPYEFEPTASMEAQEMETSEEISQTDETEEKVIGSTPGDSKGSTKKNIKKTNRKISFDLTWKECKVLLFYAIGGLLMMLGGKYLLGISDATSLVTILSYWTVITGILLGAQSIPKLFKSDSAS